MILSFGIFTAAGAAPPPWRMIYNNDLLNINGAESPYNPPGPRGKFTDGSDKRLDLAGPFNEPPFAELPALGAAPSYFLTTRLPETLCARHLEIIQLPARDAGAPDSPSASNETNVTIFGDSRFPSTPRRPTVAAHGFPPAAFPPPIFTMSRRP